MATPYAFSGGIPPRKPVAKRSIFFFRKRMRRPKGVFAPASAPPVPRVRSGKQKKIQLAKQNDCYILYNRGVLFAPQIIFSEVKLKWLQRLHAACVRPSSAKATIL
ncbi:MAG: hypothetical protein ACI4RE_01225, partial [Christensenellales bacterium]